MKFTLITIIWRLWLVGALAVKKLLCQWFFKFEATHMTSIFFRTFRRSCMQTWTASQVL
jgi:hypothetical protein